MSLSIDCLILAAILTAFGAVNVWIHRINQHDELPPADADEDADALPFGPAPRDTDH